MFNDVVSTAVIKYSNYKAEAPITEVTVISEPQATRSSAQHTALRP